MPATLRKVKGGYKVWTPNTGYHSRKPMTLRAAKAQLRLLNAVDCGWKPEGKKKIMNALNFSIKRKSGTVRDSERPKDLEGSKTFLDVPFCGSVCLLDDIESLIITMSTTGYCPFTYKIEAYPDSHHVA